jgi:hypothetical protein
MAFASDRGWCRHPLQVDTWDVAAQQGGPRWTLQQWLSHWEARLEAAAPAHPELAAAPPEEDEADSFSVQHKPPPAADADGAADSLQRVLMLPGLDPAGTSLAGQLSPPTAVAALDLASSSPRVGMAPAGAYDNFSLAPAGGAAWLHVVSGRLSLALVPPTPTNLATFAAWAAGARRAGVFLAARCEGVARADLGPGDTLLLPPGWARALAATAPALTLGGTFLRADSLAVHLDAWRIADRLGAGVPPGFKQLMWRTAERCARALQARGDAQGDAFEARVTQRAAEMAQEDAAAEEEEEAEAAARAAARAAAAAQRRAAAPAAAARAAAPPGGGRRERPRAGSRAGQPQQLAGAKRRKAASDSFIESSEEEAEGGDEAWEGRAEADWAPSSSGGEADLELCSSEDEEGWSGEAAGAGGGGARAPRRAATRRQQAVAAAAGGRRAGGARVSTRFAGSRMPAKLAAALQEEEEEDDFEDLMQEPAARAVPAVPIKLKVRLPGAPPAAPPAPAPPATGPSSPARVVLKLSKPRIPQVDGPADDDDNDDDDDDDGGGGGDSLGTAAPFPRPAAPSPASGKEEMGEGQEQGLAALLCVLRAWLRDPRAAADVPPDLGDPRQLLARLELRMRAAGIPLAPPPPIDLDAVSPRSLMPALAAARAAAARASSSSGGAAIAAGDDGGGETSPEDASCDNGVVVEESAGPKQKPVGISGGGRGGGTPGRGGARGGGAPGVAGGKGRGGKKLSVKDRLKKKLGM